ncbi:MAG TPA: metal-dependent hydrolase [Burkholderiales bacterium]|nr:metal-dependent hydrolase [Burkholderiales bacterium]
MFIGHAALGLAAKPLAPRAPLATMLVATYWLDIVWPVLLLFGVERVQIDPGNTAFTPLNFVHYPWTHSLAAAIGWSVLFGIACRRLGKRAALVVALLVFSHWLLDFVTHRADLPLWPGSGTNVGLGLWNSVPATVVIECAMLAAGAWIYARSAPPRDRTGRWAFWGLVTFLFVIYFANAFGPPPPSVTAIAIAGIAGAALFTAWAWWIDRHRGAS